jgi:hypothetical protein
LGGLLACLRKRWEFLAVRVPETLRVSQDVEVIAHNAAMAEDIRVQCNGYGLNVEVSPDAYHRPAWLCRAWANQAGALPRRRLYWNPHAPRKIAEYVFVLTIFV